MDILSPSTAVPRMVAVTPAPAERTTADELLAAAQELVQRLTYLATAQALPGDGAMQWHDQHDECQQIVSGLAAGLVFMAVPE